MIRPDCASVRERLPEVSLGLLDGEERAEVLHHVHGCARCQAVLADHTGVADLLAQVAPEVEPPPGFGERVVRSMHADRRSRRRWVATIAAVAAAAAIVSIAVVRIVDAERTGTVASAPALQSSPMVGGPTIGGHDTTVGHVVISRGSPSSVAVSVDYAVPDGSYRLVLRGAGAPARDVGTLAVSGGRGAWMGRVALTGGHRNTLTMVDANGATVCRAAFTRV